MLSFIYSASVYARKWNTFYSRLENVRPKLINFPGLPQKFEESKDDDIRCLVKLVYCVENFFFFRKQDGLIMRVLAKMLARSLIMRVDKSKDVDFLDALLNEEMPLSTMVTITLFKAIFRPLKRTVQHTYSSAHKQRLQATNLILTACETWNTFDLQMERPKPEETHGIIHFME